MPYTETAKINRVPVHAKAINIALTRFKKGQL